MLKLFNMPLPVLAPFLKSAAVLAIIEITRNKFAETHCVTSILILIPWTIGRLIWHKQMQHIIMTYCFAYSPVITNHNMFNTGKSSTHGCLLCKSKASEPWTGTHGHHMHTISFEQGECACSPEKGSNSLIWGVFESGTQNHTMLFICC